MSLVRRSLSSYSFNRRSALNLSLYLVANRPSFSDEALFLAKILSAVKGGVTCVQLRDYENDLSTIVKTARQLKSLLQGIPLFINTAHTFEVFQAVNAEGIYLENNYPYLEARKLLGREAIIGVSVKSIEDVIALGETREVDYLSVKVFASKKTCDRNDQLWGLEGLRKVRSLTPLRIVAIGGLDDSCVEAIYRELRSEDGVAMAGGLMNGEVPYFSAQKIQAMRLKIWGQV